MNSRKDLKQKKSGGKWRGIFDVAGVAETYENSIEYGTENKRTVL